MTLESEAKQATLATKQKIGVSAGVGSGRFAYPGLDRVIHQRARLSILTLLNLESRPIPCAGLAVLARLTRGNFDRHLAVLVRARLVRLSDEPGRRDRKHCEITPSGRRRYAVYLQVLRQVCADAAMSAID